jgi:hypothetical protein
MVEMVFGTTAPEAGVTRGALGPLTNNSPHQLLILLVGLVFILPSFSK